MLWMLLQKPESGGSYYTNSIIPKLSSQQSPFMSVTMLFRDFYRSQTKLAKLMFSQVFVCPQGGSLSRGVSVQGGLCPGGVSVHGGSVSMRGLCQGDPHMVKTGRYASYWNASLFQNAFGLGGRIELNKFTNQ